MWDAISCRLLVAEAAVSLGDPLTSQGPFPRWACHTELPLCFSALRSIV